MMGRYLQSRAGMFSNALRLPQARREEKTIKEAAMAKLEVMGLAGDADLSPHSLPYGRQKLLEIARALAVEPRLLLVDEPAGGLSTQENEDLAKVIPGESGRTASPRFLWSTGWSWSWGLRTASSYSILGRRLLKALLVMFRTTME